MMRCLLNQRMEARGWGDFKNVKFEEWVINYGVGT
jgi:hypothetical protein